MEIGCLTLQRCVALLFLHCVTRIQGCMSIPQGPVYIYLYNRVSCFSWNIGLWRCTKSHYLPGNHHASHL